MNPTTYGFLASIAASNAALRLERTKAINLALRQLDFMREEGTPACYQSLRRHLACHYIDRARRITRKLHGIAD